jgi:hypothetical protein
MVRDVFDSFTLYFWIASLLSRICVDESSVLHKERLNFKKYGKAKRHTFTIKPYLLRGCETGYST